MARRLIRGAFPLGFVFFARSQLAVLTQCGTFFCRALVAETSLKNAPTAAASMHAKLPARREVAALYKLRFEAGK